LHFDAVALCTTCAEENDCHREIGENWVETNTEAPPTAVDIDGRMVYGIAPSPEGLEEAKQQVDRFRFGELQELQQQLPVYRDAYLSMTKAGRLAFRRYLEAIVDLQQVEDKELLANPFCLFRVMLTVCRLEPAAGTSPYAGHYVGHHFDEVSFPKALLAAITAWDAGREFQITSLDDLQQYE
jgi:hypothetical protein